LANGLRSRSLKRLPEMPAPWQVCPPGPVRAGRARLRPPLRVRRLARSRASCAMRQTRRDCAANWRDSEQAGHVPDWHWRERLGDS
jgi:hypothetical protein